MEDLLAPRPVGGDRPVRGASAREAVRWAARHGVVGLVVQQGVRRGEVMSRLVGDPAARLDPYPLHARLREQGPVVAGRLSLMTARHDVVREALRNPVFGVVAADGSDMTPRLAGILRWSGRGAPPHPIEPPSLLAVDGAVHTRYRRLVSAVFTPRAIGRLAGRVQEIADELVDDLAARPPGTVDLVPAFTTRMPLMVIAEILGLPAAELGTVVDFGTRLLTSLDLGVGYREFRRGQVALVEFDAWLGQHLERLRRAPGEDLLSQLVTATDDGERLTERELRSLAGLLVAAGFETTSNLLGNGVQLLTEHPDQLARVQADGGLWPGAVEEVLRVESPVQITARTATEDTTLAGVWVPAGRRIVLFLGGANRDPAVFADPDRFDVTRPDAREHLAFGAGRHFCLGAVLARLEGEIGLRTLLSRFPDLRPVEGGVRTPTRVLRGWQALPVRLRG